MEFLSWLHPRIIHFPIAFFILYFILETTGVLFKKDTFTKTAYFVLILGIVTALLAVLTGNQAHESVKNLIGNDNSAVNQLIEQHENYATLSLWYYTALFFLRTYVVIKKKFTVKVQHLFILLAIIGCVLIILTGYFGGALVFEHGIGTKILSK